MLLKDTETKIYCIVICSLLLYYYVLLIHIFYIVILLYIPLKDISWVLTLYIYSTWGHGRENA